MPKRNKIQPVKDDSQREAPIIKAIKKITSELSNNKATILAFPGHKYAGEKGELTFPGLDKEYVEIWGPKAIDNDHHPLVVMDNFFDPKAEIKEALRLATELYKTKATFFSSCGASPMVSVMISSVVSKGDKILIPRHSHKSVILGLRLSGAIPIYAQPHILESKQMLLNNTPEQIEEKLSKHPDIKAVMITSPTAQGVHADVKSIAKIVHDKGKILLLDEAWGSLMPFHERFPMSGLDAGADIMVHSVHKDACGAVGSALIHVCSDKIDISRVKRQLGLLLSTSPSLWILSSQDACRQHLAYEGYNIAKRAIDLADLAKKEISKIPGFSVLDSKYCSLPGCHAISPNRVTVFMDNLGITGWELVDILVKKYGIYPTYPSFSDFVAGGTYANTIEDWKKLFMALKEISKKHYSEKHKNNQESVKLPELPPVAFSPSEASNYKKERLIPLHESLGKIVAQTVCAYPPGIAILVEGERMTESTLKFIEHYVKKINHGESKSQGFLLGLEENQTMIPIIDN